MGNFFNDTPPTPYPKEKPTQYWKGSSTFGARQNIGINGI